jgi:hypothetical protein
VVVQLPLPKSALEKKQRSFETNHSPVKRIYPKDDQVLTNIYRLAYGYIKITFENTNQYTIYLKMWYANQEADPCT